MIGHNHGPTMEAGASWRKHCWTKARKDLLKTIPIEILRVRVARAAELGLEYKSYASIRAASGHDVIAFLFSSNALRVFPKDQAMPDDRIFKLEKIENVNRLVALQGNLKELPKDSPMVDSCFTAPDFSHSWGQTRDILLDQVHQQKLPRSGVVVVGDTSQERVWHEAARLAGYVSADQFFGADVRA